MEKVRGDGKICYLPKQIEAMIEVITATALKLAMNTKQTMAMQTTVTAIEPMRSVPTVRMMLRMAESQSNRVALNCVSDCRIVRMCCIALALSAHSDIPLPRRVSRNAVTSVLNKFLAMFPSDSHLLFPTTLYLTSGGFPIESSHDGRLSYERWYLSPNKIDSEFANRSYFSYCGRKIKLRLSPRMPGTDSSLCIRLMN